MSATVEITSVADRRRAWEAPALTTLSLRAGTRERIQPTAEPLPCPEPSRPAEMKPGMYIELLVATAKFSPVG